MKLQLTAIPSKYQRTYVRKINPIFSLQGQTLTTLRVQMNCT